MSSSQEAKVHEDFIARCNELKIKAKEKENKPLSLLPNGITSKHPGHYRAPAFASFERQHGFIPTANKVASRPSNQRQASETSKTSEAAPSFCVSTPNISKPSTASRKEAIAKCHKELATCYEKLAVLYALEAEETLENEG